MNNTQYLIFRKNKIKQNKTTHCIMLNDKIYDEKSIFQKVLTFTDKFVLYSYIFSVNLSSSA